MKKIIWTKPETGALMITSPLEGERLASNITLEDGTVLQSPRPYPVRVDQFLRGWPVAGATAAWAETEPEFLYRVQLKSVPANALDTQVVDEFEIPDDREFRDGLRLVGGEIRHNMPACVEIRKQQLRALRAPKLAALDVEFMRAMEANNQAAIDRISAAKQALRDVTNDPALASAATIDDLRAVLPAALQ
jgi:hypothetical protein